MNGDLNSPGPAPCRPVCRACGNPRCPGVRVRPPRRRRDARRAAGLTAAFVLVSYGAFVGPSAAAPSSGECAALGAQMRALASDRIGEMVEWYDRESEGYAEGNAEFSGLELGNDAAEPPSDPLPEAAAEAVGSGPTGTNIAERDVDEPDVAKVDGSRVYRVWGQGDWELDVVETASGRPRLAGWVKPSFPHGAREMFLLDGHRLLVVGSTDEDAYYDDGAERRPRVVLTLVDVADSARPVVLRTSTVTGRYISGRLSDGVVRLVLSNRTPLSFSPPKLFEPAAVAAARNRVALLRKDGEDWLPRREIFDAAGELVYAGPALGCADVHRPAEPRGTDLLSVLAVDSRQGPDALDRTAGTGLVGGADVVYAAADRLYVASGVRPGEWDGSASSGGTTTVHAFDTTGRRAGAYVGTGRVPGRLVGPSALSRYAGHLRVAVTGGQASSVHVLAESGGGVLREVGRVSNLGPGEEIRSVRWFGPMATVVTFRQTDPFYVLDLTRPAAPRLRGALKIPGYSGYLHPVGAGRVLGVGQANRGGGDLGLQLSAFDVSDPARPRRTDNLVLPGGSALVQDDSRAFAYLPASGLAVLPALVQAECAHRAVCWTVPGSPAYVRVDSSERNGIPAALAVSIDAAGKLREVARFLADAPVLRIMPLGAGRLAAVTESAIVLLDADDLRPLGNLVLDPRFRPEQ